MSRRHALSLLAVASLAAPLAACQSTQDRAKEVQARAAELIATQVPLEIPKPNKDIELVSATIVSDENGSAVVVEARNGTKRTLVGVPILISVRDAKGKQLFVNDAWGTEFALQHIPIMKPGETVFWVHDQLLTGGTPESVKVKMGQPQSVNPGPLPEIALSPPRIENDPLGVVARGTATNKSEINQKGLVLFAVVRSGGEIVAAGRGAYKNLKTEARPAPYNIFFYGDARGGDVEITAPPSVFE